MVNDIQEDVNYYFSHLNAMKLLTQIGRLEIFGCTNFPTNKNKDDYISWLSTFQNYNIVYKTICYIVNEPFLTILFISTKKYDYDALLSIFYDIKNYLDKSTNTNKPQILIENDGLYNIDNIYLSDFDLYDLKS